MKSHIGVSASLCVLAALLPAGCPSGQTNPFLTLTENFVTRTPEEVTPPAGGSGGTVAEGEFRRKMTVTFANNNPNGTLNLLFAAWVNTSSIRSADQQDALLRGGYVQLTREVRVGSVFTLPPGTFVFNGPGLAGATTIRLRPAGAGNPPAATTQATELITPDVILAFAQPPVSCESVAFFFTLGDEPLPSEGIGFVFQGSTLGGGLKTLAQVDAYQCEPLKPGLFLKLGGGARQPSEFFEGENVRFDFFLVPNADGDAAIVTIESQ